MSAEKQAGGFKKVLGLVMEDWGLWVRCIFMLVVGEILNEGGKGVLS